MPAVAMFRIKNHVGDMWEKCGPRIEEVRSVALRLLSFLFLLDSLDLLTAEPASSVRCIFFLTTATPALRGLMVVLMLPPQTGQYSALQFGAIYAPHLPHFLSSSATMPPSPSLHFLAWARGGIVSLDVFFHTL